VATPAVAASVPVLTTTALVDGLAVAVPVEVSLKYLCLAMHCKIFLDLPRNSRIKKYTVVMKQSNLNPCNAKHTKCYHLLQFVHGDL